MHRPHIWGIIPIIELNYININIGIKIFQMSRWQNSHEAFNKFSKIIRILKKGRQRQRQKGFQSTHIEYKNTKETDHKKS